MKLTRRGYRITKNGSVMKSIEKEAIIRECNTDNMLNGRLDKTIKVDGVYYFFNRKQGNNNVYLP